MGALLANLNVSKPNKTNRGQLAGQQVPYVTIVLVQAPHICHLGMFGEVDIISGVMALDVLHQGIDL